MVRSREMMTASCMCALHKDPMRSGLLRMSSTHSAQSDGRPHDGLKQDSENGKSPRSICSHRMDDGETNYVSSNVASGKR